MDDRDARRPTMADVAERVGVSRALVSLVFRGKEGASQQTRERVFEAARELGYRPDTAAQLLRSRRSRHLGALYVPTEPFHADVIDALYPVAEKSGYDVVLGALTQTRDVTKATEELLGFRCEAVLLIGVETTHAQLTSLASQAPLVVVGPHQHGPRFDTVRSDDVRGARQAVDHLVGLGHRRIVHIDGGHGPAAADRRRGYRNAMRKHGLAEHVHMIPGDYTEECGALAAQELFRMDPLPTAVFAANDRCAVGLLHALRRMGVTVPGDISIVGFDGSRAAQLPHIDLTTVRQDIPGTAEAAIDTALERLDEERTEAKQVVLRTQLIVRSTTAPPAS
ncbi:LacI family DNA-binding transcriptional regulator [Actinophytocola sp.]|uniref:LacI family DNA-binding transcriptional regulator n=1 Tax=Actinophytocola sp. TaxID=1872138 RepID=UPI002ED0C892